MLLKISYFLGYITLNWFIFFPRFFLISHNTAMIYNTKNRSNDTDSQIEKKTYLNAHFQYSQSKTTGLKKMYSLKSLTMLQEESRTSPHAVQYK